MTRNEFIKLLKDNLEPNAEMDFLVADHNPPIVAFLDVYHGAELYQIDKNGVETLIAIFSEIDGKFMPIK